MSERAGTLRDPLLLLGATRVGNLSWGNPSVKPGAGQVEVLSFRDRAIAPFPRCGTRSGRGPQRVVQAWLFCQTVSERRLSGTPSRARAQEA